MSNSSDCYKSRTQAKILFLETQLQELNRYLPETHEYLVSELDHQMRRLAELSVNEYFASLDSENSI